MRILLLLFISFPFIHCLCPDGFELVAAGECRKLDPISLSVTMDEATDAAISQCKSFDAQPVIIHNGEQQAYWTEKWNTYMSTKLLLGITCNTNTREWQWVDGSAIDYKPPSSAGGYDKDLDQYCTNGYTWYIVRSDGYWYSYSSHSEYTFDIYCTIQLPHPIPSEVGCESFEDDSEDGVCYQVQPTAEGWIDAQLSCGNIGAEVASIHNQKENSFIRRLAASQGTFNGLYLGAYMYEKKFEWIDGSAWDYANFYFGFPDDGGLGKCLVMDTEGTSGEWANVDCSAQLSVACMRQRNYSSTCSPGPWKEGQVVVILEANSCCDHVSIVDNYFGGNMIANLTGAMNDEVFTTSSSNFMRVSWQPNGGVNVKGLAMTFRAI